jgi:hypothetical protein
MMPARPRVGHTTAPGSPLRRLLVPPEQTPEQLSALRPVALATAGALLGVGGIHLAWALGSTWPLDDPESLARTVLGIPGAEAMPTPAMTLGIVGALTTAAAAAVARCSLSLRTRTISRVLTLGAGSVLALRGVSGFAEAIFMPEMTTPEFRTMNLLLYSPVTLALAAGLFALERRPRTARSKSPVGIA